MRNFNQIINTLKTIIGCTTDKAIAIELHIKPVTFASMKRRNKIPHKAIITYCADSLIDANIILFGDSVTPEIKGKIVVKYFQSIEAYELYLGLSK